MQSFNCRGRGAKNTERDKIYTTAKFNIQYSTLTCCGRVALCVHSTVRRVCVCRVQEGNCWFESIAQHDLISAAKSMIFSSIADSPAGFVDIVEYSSLEDGFNACIAQGTGLPFVVRKTIEFAESTSAAISSQLRKETSVTGYQNGKSIRQSGAIALESWQNSQCVCNIVDSVSNRGKWPLLPIYLSAIAESADVEDSVLLAYVLSPVSTCMGELHVDPPFGSNWQYLAEGKKIWYAIDSSHFSLVEYNKTLGELQRLEPPDLVNLSMKYKIFTAIIGCGDFISVPIYWPHAVFTVEISLGLSGYSATPEMIASAAAVRLDNGNNHL